MRGTQRPPAHPESAAQLLLARQVLPAVRTPSRYLGIEHNSVHKDPASVALRAVLGFPDSYELGLGNLGLHIVYDILNAREDTWCERVYAPAADLEAELRARGLPLFSLESKTALRDFDLVGFTLQWELTYTNLLNMIDLGGITLHSAERGDDEPVVIAGGPCVWNPEPLADFIDAFVLGDGEEAVVELADAVLAGGGRSAVLDRLAKLKGVYVPACYPEPTLRGGWLVAPPGAPAIEKRLVTDLEDVPYPTAQIVPFTEQVHDRVSLEVLRGCTHGCRFCQAGMVGRPVRERSLPNLAQLQTDAMAATGYEELSLVSLSTVDHSQARAMTRQAVGLATADHVTVGLPSLRMDRFSVDLAEAVGSARRTGLTFAPEAATDRLRAVINKPISDEQVLAAVEASFEHGFDTVKLYFMIGLPTETDEDVLAIGDLCERVLQAGRRHSRRARVNLGVSTFVPKPWTPFQWAEQIESEEIRRRQRLLRGSLPKAIKFGRHESRATHLEGILGRLDRRGGQLLERAWRLGARFDGWTELLDDEAWNSALAAWTQATGLTEAVALGPRDPAQRLPWDHLEPLVTADWLRADWYRAQAGQSDVDCRLVGCRECGVMLSQPAACGEMLATAAAGGHEPADVQLAAPWAEPPAAVKMRFRWSREGWARLTSHHEVLNVFVRAIRRARLPMRYSEGFHPHAELAFSSALPVGLETGGDWCDVTLTEMMAPSEFAERLAAELPAGFGLLAAWQVPLDEPALMSTLRAARYAAHVPPDLGRGIDSLAVRDLLAAAEVIVARRGKQRGNLVHRPINIRPMVAELSLTDAEDGGKVITMCLVPDGDRLPKADEVLAALGGWDRDQLNQIAVTKIASYAWLDGDLVEPQPPDGGTAWNASS